MAETFGKTGRGKWRLRLLSAGLCLALLAGLAPVRLYAQTPAETGSPSADAGGAPPAPDGAAAPPGGEDSPSAEEPASPTDLEKCAEPLREVQPAAATLPTAEELAALLDAVSLYQRRTITSPSVGTTHGEWAVLALARHGSITAGFRQTYLQNLYAITTTQKGVLDKNLLTEHSRVIMALAALEEDPRNVAGYDLTAPLADQAKVTGQGPNGAAWALIALDTRNYPVPAQEGVATQTTREGLVDALLGMALPGGGWTLQGATADPDITGMALMALAPYRAASGVEAAVQAGLAALWARQNPATRGWGTCESTAQVIQALCTLGITPDAAVYGALMDFYLGDGSFKHAATGTAANPMATDQAMCALVALQRMMNGQSPLYQMGDAGSGGVDEEAERAAIAEGVAALPSPLGILHKGAVALLSARLARLAPFEGKQALADTLATAAAAIAAIEEAVKKLDADIWDKIDPMSVTLKDGPTVAALLKTYNALHAQDKPYLTNAQSLLDAKIIVDALESGVIPGLVFQNLKGAARTYRYEGEGYTLSFKGSEVAAPADMDAGLTLGDAEAGMIKTVMPGAYWLQLAATGPLPAKITVSAGVGAQNGAYTLYSYSAATSAIQNLGSATVGGGRLTFTTGTGGIFFLLPVGQPPAALPGAGGTLRLAAGVDGGITKEMFEWLMGQDINIRLEGATKAGRGWRLTFNGLDVTQPMDFDATVLDGGAHAESIQRLAEEPFIFRLSHTGALPGKMLVELETDLADESFLLLRYNAADQRAELCQRVDVAGGWAAFFLTGPAGELFLAKRASKHSIPELDAQKAAQTMAEGPAAPAAPEVPVAAAATPAALAPQMRTVTRVIYWPIVLGVCAGAAVLAVLALGLRRRALRGKAAAQNKEVPHEETRS